MARNAQSNFMNTETKPIKLAAICIDGGTQTRAALNEDAVDDYAEAMINGSQFPPIVVFNDGSAMWLADGFHRCHASKKAGLLDIIAEVHKGTRRDAVKFAIQANQKGSVRRTNADKRKCVEIALAEFPDLSDRALAEMCGVSNKTVAAAREQAGNFPTSTPTPEAPKTRKGKDGKEYPAPEPKPEPIPEPETQPEPAEDMNNDSPTEEVETNLPEVPAKKRGSYEDWKSFRDIADRMFADCKALHELKVDHAHLTAARDLAAKLSKELMKVSNNQK
jgi:hypothetical protein